MMSELLIEKTFNNSLTSRSRRIAPRFIVVHHTCTRTPTETRSVLKNRNLSTHFEIDSDGRIYQYLDPASRVASHVGQYNSQSIGIDLTHMPGDSFSSVQMKSLASLVRMLCSLFFIPFNIAPEKEKYYLSERSSLPFKIFGIYRHSNLARTRCPDGAPLEDFLIKRDPGD